VTYWLAWLLIAYGIATLWLVMGMSRRYPHVDDEFSVSLIVCLRDEETNLPGLLQCLNALDYPEDRLEIILVNDRSTDDTSRMISDFQKTSRFPVATETIVENESQSGHPERSEGSPNGEPSAVNASHTGKMRALIRGLKLAKNDVYILTDADARPDPHWIRQMVSYFDADVGLIGGSVRIAGNTLWDRLQALDWTYLFAAGAGTAGWNVPQSVFGKNVAIRATAYDEIGTLEALPFSVTEDLALLAAVRDRTKWKILLPMEESLAMDALPTPSLKTLWHQRRRWLLGGIKITSVGRLLILIMLLLSLAILVSLFVDPAWAIGLFLIQCILDIPLAASALGRLGRFNWIVYWPLYRIVFTILIVFLVGSLLFCRSIRWKGQIYR
jgi:1,2-diacylglycerol 3-beta-glucosyltransferase